MDWLKHAQQTHPAYFDDRSRELIGAQGEPTATGRVITWQTDHGPHRFYVLDDGEPSFVRPDNTVILYGQKLVVEIDPHTGRIVREVERLR